jgi:glycosyltransferase involved in cell wall biosynthesis
MISGKKMKIAVYHNLPSGGAKRMMYEIIRHLSEVHEFDVFTYNSSNHDFADIRPYVKNHQQFDFKTSGLFSSPFGRFNQLVRLVDLIRIQNLDRKIAAVIENGQYDLVWVNPCQIQNSPSILRHIKKIPSVFICQEPLRILYEQMPARPYDKKDGRLTKVLNFLDPLPGIFFGTLRKNDRRNILSATKVLVNSGFMRSTVSQVYPVTPFVNYAGVDSDFFHPVDLPEGNFVFSAGSLTPLKGYDFIITALANIPEEFRPPFVIACNFENPPEKEFLINLAKKLNVNLSIKSSISDHELMELYNRARLTVYSPIREPFGLVAVESMACGTPVVGVREGGLIETIEHEKTGILTERDAMEFGAAIQQLLFNSNKLERFRKAGREAVLEKWTWKISAETINNHFMTLVNNASSS